ncbi:odorant receptor 22c-like [Microplitis mediator]|uniref:odorant receptor 22c-like n=1 Tax=Microplitis mediator TaxID=375433 RepID=UPI0025558239|nr:odorant receptor 22c-like [Microplitis mediator]
MSETKMSRIETINSVPFEEFFNAEIRMLRYMGLSWFNSVFSNDENRREKWWEKITPLFGILILSLMLYFLTVALINIITIDITLAPEMFTALLSSSLCCFKAIRCWTHRKELFDFIRQLKVLWDTAASNKFITENIFDSVVYAKSLRNQLAVGLFLLVVTYGFSPYVILCSHFLSHRDEYFFNFSIIVYPISYPFEVNTFPRYFICLFFEQTVILLCYIYWLCGDVMFIQLTTHVGIHSTILVNRLHNLDRVAISDPKNKNIYHELSDIVASHYQQFIYCHWLRKFFSPIVLFVTLINGANLCFSLFRVDEEINDRNWSGLIVNVVHLLAVFGQTILYCMHAEILSAKLEEINYAAYFCDWTNSDEKFRAMVLMIMKRAQKEFKFTVYGIITFNLNQFTKIVNAAMSYFTLLRSFG